MPEHPKIDHRVLLGQLPDQKHHKADSSQPAKPGNHRIGEPVAVPPQIEHDLQAADPEQQQPQPHPVDWQLGGFGLEPFEQRKGAKPADQRDGHVDQENPVPVEAV